MSTGADPVDVVSVWEEAFSAVAVFKAGKVFVEVWDELLGTDGIADSAGVSPAFVCAVAVEAL
jgi:hypothetical protein